MNWLAEVLGDTHQEAIRQLRGPPKTERYTSVL
jgi:hypothetical protein